MPGPIVSRPLLRNALSAVVAVIGTLTVSTLLTISSGGVLNFADGVANGVLFLDSSKNASSTSRIAVDGNLGVVTSTKLVVGNGTSGSPSISFSGNQTDGLWLNATNYPQLKGTTGLQMSAGGSLYQYNSTAFYPDTSNARTLGDSTHYWSTIFGTNVMATTAVTSSRFIGGAGSTSNASFNFGGASNDIDTGLAQTDTTDSFDFIAGGNWRGRFNTSNFRLNVDTVANLDATYDIGSQSLRFQDGFFSGTVSSSALIASAASSTFFLSGASALVSTVAPIPTSTSFLAGTMPNQLYLFNATNTNCIYWTPGQLRGSWTGGNLTPVISWIPAATGTGDVVWRFAAQSLADNTYVGTAFAGPYSYATSTVGDNLTRQIENMDSVAAQSAASGIPIRFEGCRMGGQAGDTFGGDAYLELIKGEYSTPNYSD